MNRFVTTRGGSVLAAFMLPVVMAGPLYASEDDSSHGGVHEFHEMMEELGEHTQGIAGAINHEDWARVADLAEMIADHPRPPAEERQRIKSFAGERRARFAEYDKAVHSSAAELAEIASAGDGREVINAFARLQTSCLDCHAAFRADFRQHFYLKK